MSLIISLDRTRAVTRGTYYSYNNNELGILPWPDGGHLLADPSMKSRRVTPSAEPVTRTTKSLEVRLSFLQSPLQTIRKRFGGRLSCCIIRFRKASPRHQKKKKTERWKAFFWLVFPARAVLVTAYNGAGKDDHASDGTDSSAECRGETGRRLQPMSKQKSQDGES